MSIVEHLQAGAVGPLLELVYRVAGTQVRFHPGPYRDDRADPDLAKVVAHDFITDRWDRTVNAVLAQANDDVSAERLLHTIIANWLIDKFRQTERGSIARTLAKHLDDHDEFERVPAKQEGAGRWRLAGTTPQPWSGSLGVLVAAASAVRARAVRWSSTTRRAPIAPAADLSAVLRAVLSAAEGSLSEQQLVEVVVHRFPATLSTPALPPAEWVPTMDVAADPGGSAGEQWQAQQDHAASKQAVETVVRQLTADDRHLLRLLATRPLAQVAAEAQEELGCGRSRAYEHIKRVRALVRELAAAADDGEQVVLDVLAWCRAEIDPGENEQPGTTVVDDGAGAPSDGSRNPMTTGRATS